MKRSKRLRWLGAEFTIIVLGVLSALFVDTWLGDYQDGKRAELYRDQLITDLSVDVINYNSRIDYYNRIRDFGLAALKDLEGEEPMDDFALLFAAFNAAEEWPLSAESSAFEDMKNTGNTHLLSDDLQLRLSLTRYYRDIDARSVVWNLPRDFRRIARGIVPNPLQQAIHSKCNETPKDELEVEDVRTSESTEGYLIRSQRTLDGSFCDIDLADYASSAAAEQLRNHPDAIPALRFRMSEARVANQLFAEQLSMAEDLLKQLAEQ